MAPRKERRTPEQKAAVAEFVDRLFAQSGAKKWTEFAALADVHWASLSDWHTGKVVPDGWNMLQLLTAVSPERAAVALGGVAGAREQAAPRARPAEVQAAVGDLLDWQTTVVADLAELRTRLEQLENAPASKQRTRRRATGTDG